MKKIIVFIFLLQVLAFASTGWFNDFITINGTVFYIGSNPGTGTQLDGYNFGVINSLTITNADMKYWDDGNQPKRTGGAFYWNIMSDDNKTVIVSTNETIWSQVSIGGNDYQGTWSGSINIINSLQVNTTYKLHICSKSWGSGDSWLSNASKDYVATFTTNSTLPVELTSFTANFKGNAVSLKWATATEINNNKFEIERKSNNSNWVNIASINGNGNSNSTKNYSFTDNSPLSGKSYYRLKQIDNDGKFEYSKEVEITNNTAKSFELLQNYPNPFNPSTTITYSIPNSSDVRLSVYNILGREVARLVNGKMEAGTHSVYFDASNLSSGLYIAKISSNSFSKFIKMNLIK